MMPTRFMLGNRAVRSPFRTFREEVAAFTVAGLSGTQKERPGVPRDLTCLCIIA